MITGAIDVGSNTVKLLVADVRGDRIRPLEIRSAITRLGGGMDRTRRLSPAAQDRTISTLKKFAKRCRELSAGRVLAVGTEALRSAQNGSAFVRRCRRETGISVRILSGREEARLAFLGATTGRRERKLAAIDIGGGSTEIMIGRPGRLEAAVSLPLGAVRLTELHLKSDPPKLAERLSMLQHVCDVLSRLAGPVRRAVAGGAILLGIGGTCVNVARMARPRGSPDGRVVTLETLEDILHRLAVLPLAKRKRVPGIDPDRADIILAGARIMAETLRELGRDAFTATVHGLRRGVILSAVRYNRPTP